MHTTQTILGCSNSVSRRLATGKASVAPQPWKDVIEPFAEHCSQTTMKLLGASPLYFQQPAFATPQIELWDFIERLLRATNAPLSAAVASLAVIYWITNSGTCPLASSSPHHLFMATHQAVLHPAWDMRDVDEEWVKHAGGLVPLAEVSAMRVEVEEMLPTLGLRRWAVISDLVSEDINKSIDNLYYAERIQVEEEAEDAKELDRTEEDELVGSGFLVYERDLGSGRSKYNSDDDEHWSDDSDIIIIRQRKTPSWMGAIDEPSCDSKAP